MNIASFKDLAEIAFVYKCVVVKIALIGTRTQNCQSS